MQDWQEQILEREGFNKTNKQQKTITMDLRKLTIERLEELIAINERKMGQPHNQSIIGKLTAIRITLERALEWKQQNA
jgi:hypothetical protein